MINLHFQQFIVGNNSEDFGLFATGGFGYIINFNKTETPTHFLLDINNFMVGRGETSRVNVINNSLREIAMQLIDTNFKLLITCPIYNNAGNDEYNFSGGNTGLYMADFVGIIREDRVRIMKNRHGESQIDIKL